MTLPFRFASSQFNPLSCSLQFAAALSSSYENRNFVATLKKSLLINEILPVESDKIHQAVLKSPQTVYCGFDPTASSLHLGNLRCLVNLILCQRAGHKVIVVVGGATALLGDPSGLPVTHVEKNDDRRRTMSDEEVVANSVRIQKSVARLFTNHEKEIWNDSRAPLAPVRILNNLQWYGNMNLVHFLAKFGRTIRIGDMLSRKCVKQRIQADNSGLSFAEFSYQALQAYDWLHLNKTYDCRFQLGGSDQQGNMMAGIALVEKQNKQKVFGLCVPLLTDKSGRKLSKSTGRVPWLDEQDFTAYQLYQHLRNTSDSDVESYLRMFTFLTGAELKALMAKHKSAPEEYRAQITLAKEVVRLVHGGGKLDEALICTEAVFASSFQSLAKLDRDMAASLFKDVPRVRIPFEIGLTVANLLVKVGICETSEGACVLIEQQKSIYINHVRVANPQSLMLMGEHVMPAMFTLLAVGKKNHTFIEWVPGDNDCNTHCEGDPVN